MEPTNGTYYKVPRDSQSPIDSQRHNLAQWCIFLTDCLQAKMIDLYAKLIFTFTVFCLFSIKSLSLLVIKHRS